MLDEISVHGDLGLRRSGFVLLEFACKPYSVKSHYTALRKCANVCSIDDFCTASTHRSHRH
jgi:hypothetical protein